MPGQNVTHSFSPLHPGLTLQVPELTWAWWRVPSPSYSSYCLPHTPHICQTSSLSPDSHRSQPWCICPGHRLRLNQGYTTFHPPPAVPPKWGKKGGRISLNGFSPPKPWTCSDLLPQACSPLAPARRSSQYHWLGRWACTCPEETRLSTWAPTPQQGWAGWCCGCSHWKLHTAPHGSSCQRLGREKTRAGS